ncbi:hypothetical protein OA824_22725 [Citrobacter portucalensis]|nr:hypothetical protein [Citrobacter portucalensis]MDN4386672.1 hypothetical protein [Citrobacter portucalensis]MDN4405976.1 hypothetical protein [Citrobacter portucalensis]MDN4446410.1 hypothetical protein [Citrobacter portucalensis]
MKSRKLKKPNYLSIYIQLLAYVVSGFYAIWIGDGVALAVLTVYLLLFAFFINISRKFIRAGCDSSVKAIINALWNFETACAFVYGVYTFIRYKLIEPNDTELMVSYVKQHPYFFYLMLTLLVVTVMFRAAFSVAELITFDSSNSYEKETSKI